MLSVQQTNPNAAHTDVVLIEAARANGIDRHDAGTACSRRHPSSQWTLRAHLPHARQPTRHDQDTAIPGHGGRRGNSTHRVSHSEVTLTPLPYNLLPLAPTKPLGPSSFLLANHAVDV